MNDKETFYPEAYFGDFTDIDGTVAFFTRVNALIDPSFVVLDVGCGRGAYNEDPVKFRKNLRILKGKAAQVIGIDLDLNAKENPCLDDFRLIKGDDWPIESNSIDLIVCDNVLEHVPDPDRLFVEIHRVLKNGGYLCLRTPNRWSYIAIAATLIPNSYHSNVVAFAQDGRKQEDVFPTVYKCNSVRKLKNIMEKNGMESVVYGHEAEPSYLSFSKIAYFLGVIYQRFSPKFIKSELFAFGKIKKEIIDVAEFGYERDIKYNTEKDLSDHPIASVREDSAENFVAKIENHTST
jgi:SAM-dependent methyltransferase